MIQLISADASTTIIVIIDEVNVETLTILNVKQIKRLRSMVDQGKVTEKALATE